ncbi:hypothetical protein CFter6_2447 [Collimonas fungivorans]|uniref:Uncharacterized protein n=1 Tax=Collimonas fungivorans TaxID=158899 RepID=A0A127PBB2_9BURK|nr:hypothetical protein CFter6_2447 [Collimonas fungivorans]
MHLQQIIAGHPNKKYYKIVEIGIYVILNDFCCFFDFKFA